MRLFKPDIIDFQPIFRHIATHSINLNHAINRFIRSGNLDGARDLFDRNPISRNVVSWNSMIMAYFRQDQVQQAEELFDQMPYRDLIAWNTMLSGFRHTNQPQQVYSFFRQMNRVGERPNELTFAVAISAFLETKFNILIPQLHSLVIFSGVKLNVFVGSALMRGYTDLGSCEGLDRVFDDILLGWKDVIPWNVLILGYMEFGLTSKAQEAFDMMTPEKNFVTWSTLINGYLKNRDLDKARLMFDKMTEKDVVSWSAMLKGYVQKGHLIKALDLFLLMLTSSTRPNHFTLSTILDACAGYSSLAIGIQVHTLVLKMGICRNVIISTSLVDMYAKCGDIQSAFLIFNSMRRKTLASWNSIIGGCAKHGLGCKAVEEFENMLKSGIKPDEITFINALSACVHGGMVEEGERIFRCMGREHGVEPEVKHYACMVDLYGRAGELDKAEGLIKEGMLLFEADVVVWGAFLQGCGLHSYPEGEGIAAKQMIKLERDHPAAHSASSKTLGKNGATDISTAERKWRARKQKAGSWVEL
ncbi:unnamed protein product [Cuscuta epithymum]|uniref:Pentatricopeptide repeat-containing protein n=1 Tax=Cuscuta epithymum TaxID=186058 RepID=A0AAV0FB05_9ASTE|nr:unnamed protein product [Cuscuta epithymum]